MSDGVRVLGLTLLHFLWQGALIALVTGAALRAASHATANRRYLICLGGLLACAIAPGVTGLVLLAGAPRDLPGSAAGLEAGRGIAVAQSAVANVTSGTNAASGSTAVGTIGVESTPGVSWLTSVDLISVTVVLWLLGALVAAAYYALQWHGVGRVQRSAVPLDPSSPLARAAASLLARWKAAASVPVMLSELVVTPVVIGVWRPMIVFPAATLARMPVADFELILLHEIAHIVRRDAWVNVLQVVLEIVFFYQPAVRWLSRRARLERECACDDFAVAASGSAFAYARALTTLAVPREDMTALALGASSDLLPRLRHLAGECVDGPRGPMPRAYQHVVIGLLIGSLWLITPLEPWRQVFNAIAGRFISVEQSSQVPSPERSRDPERPTPNRQVNGGALGALSVEQHLGPRAESRTREEARRGNETQSVPLVDASAAISSVRVEPLPLELPSIELVTVPVDFTPPLLANDALEVIAADEAPSEPEVQPASPQPAESALVREVVATYSPAPEYPVRARLEGIEGVVEVLVQVASDGRAKGLQILSAQPLGVFEGAVRRAVMDWRYDVPTGWEASGNATVIHRLRFSITEGTSVEAPACTSATVSHTCRASERS